MSSGLSRRAFTERLALAALAPLAGLPPLGLPGMLSAPVAPAGLPAPADLDALAKAFADVIRVQYGDRLDAAAMDEITRRIKEQLEQAEALRKVPLDYTAEPDVTFVPHGVARAS